jgi:hypothetical protein
MGHHNYSVVDKYLENIACQDDGDKTFRIDIHTSKSKGKIEFSANNMITLALINRTNNRCEYFNQFKNIDRQWTMDNIRDFLIFFHNTH